MQPRLEGCANILGALTLRSRVPRFRVTIACLVLALLQVLVGSARFDTAFADSTFVRGDSNGDSQVLLPDVVELLSYLFLGVGIEPDCFDAFDVNDSGVIELNDAILSLNYQFLGGAAPPEPFPSCGVDPTPDDLLDCVSVTACFDESLAAPQVTPLFANREATSDVGLYLPVVSQPLPLQALQFVMQHLQIDAPAGAPSTPLILDADAAQRIQIYGADDEPLALPALIDGTELPLTIRVAAVAAGEVVLSVLSESTGVADSVRLRCGRFPGLAGQSLSQYPFFQFVRSFNDLDDIEIALDPQRHLERGGMTFDVYVVDHRTPEQWIADASLVDVSGFVESGRVSTGSIELSRMLVGTGLPTGDHLGAGYDIVLDFDHNGTLDPGDMIDSLLATEAGFYKVKDTTTPGPHAVASFDHDSGAAFGLQRVFYPTNLSDLGRVPLVVISHGNGHQFTWYEYLQSHLASYGYIVTSHQNNTVPGYQTASTSTLVSTDVILGDQGVAGGGVLDGHIDGSKIVWIGHSRGGQGVVRAYNRLVTGSYISAAFDEGDIAVICAIAPTVFDSVANWDPGDANLHLLAGGADGDVTGGVDCDACQFFRIAQAARGNVQVTYVHGADHNDFNCCGPEDAVGPDAIGRFAAQRVAKGYLLALVEYYTRGNPAAKEYFTRMFDDLKPSGVGSEVICANQFRAEQATTIDDFQGDGNVDLTSIGAPVQFDVVELAEGLLNDSDTEMAWGPVNGQFNGMTQAAVVGDDESGVVFGFLLGSDTYYQLGVPRSRSDFAQHDFLSFRSCQASRHPATNFLAEPLYFAVSLTDSMGVTSTIRTDNYGGVTRPYLRTGLGVGAGWSNEFCTTRIRLAAFETNGSGIDLGSITAVRFLFGEDHGSVVGRVGLDRVVLEME